MLYTGESAGTEESVGGDIHRELKNGGLSSTSYSSSSRLIYTASSARSVVALGSGLYGRGAPGEPEAFEKRHWGYRVL